MRVIPVVLLTWGYFGSSLTNNDVHKYDDDSYVAESCVAETLDEAARAVAREFVIEGLALRDRRQQTKKLSKRSSSKTDEKKRKDYLYESSHSASKKSTFASSSSRRTNEKDESDRLEERCETTPMDLLYEDLAKATFSRTYLDAVDAFDAFRTAASAAAGVEKATALAIVLLVIEHGAAPFDDPEVVGLCRALDKPSRESLVSSLENYFGDFYETAALELGSLRLALLGEASSHMSNKMARSQPLSAAASSSAKTSTTIYTQDPTPQASGSVLDNFELERSAIERVLAERRRRVATAVASPSDISAFDKDDDEDDYLNVGEEVELWIDIVFFLVIFGAACAFSAVLRLLSRCFYRVSGGYLYQTEHLCPSRHSLESDSPSRFLSGGNHHRKRLDNGRFEFLFDDEDLIAALGGGVVKHRQQTRRKGSKNEAKGCKNSKGSSSRFIKDRTGISNQKHNHVTMPTLTQPSEEESRRRTFDRIVTSDDSDDTDDEMLLSSSLQARRSASPKKKLTSNCKELKGRAKNVASHDVQMEKALKPSPSKPQTATAAVSLAGPLRPQQPQQPSSPQLSLNHGPSIRRYRNVQIEAQQQWLPPGVRTTQPSIVSEELSFAAAVNNAGTLFPRAVASVKVVPLPPNFDNDDLRERFAKYEGVLGVRVFRDASPPHGFVDFSCRAEAVAAAFDANGSSLLVDSDLGRVACIVRERALSEGDGHHHSGRLSGGINNGTSFGTPRHAFGLQSS